MSAPSSPITRMIAAVTSLGTSEFAQKKPFQNITDEDRPTGGGGGSLGRFIPGGGEVGAAADFVAPGVTGPGTPDKKTLKSAENARTADAAKSASEYLAANPLPQTPEEEEQARVRAERLGRSGSKRASQYLASSSGGL